MSKNLTDKQKSKIYSSALSLVASANEGVSPYRQVTNKTALTIVDRSLRKTIKLPFSIREYLAVRDVSDFISVSQKNKTNLNKRRNTDLLPVCHPASTKKHAMTASALRAEKGKWLSGDPRITSDEAKSLIASAFSSEPFSPEEAYYLTRLSALPQGTVPLTAIVAAFGDGNSTAARSMRAKLQRRDRRGRFAWQGGGMSTLVRRGSGVVSRLTGRTVSQGVGTDDTFDVELPDGKIARVPAKSSEGSRAYLPSADAPDGFSPIAAESVVNTPTVEESDLVFVDAPNGFRQQDYDGAGIRYTDDAYNVTKLDPNDPDQQEEIPDDFFRRDIQGNLPMDESKPVYMVTRDDGTPVTSFDEGPMQSWGDVQDAIRVDEIVRDRQEGREPDPIATLDQDTLIRVADIADEEGRDPYEVVSEITGQKFEAPEVSPSPERDSFDLVEFEDPTGLFLVDDADSYIAQGRTNQESEDYTDDPAILAQMFDEADLIEALREAVTPNDMGEIPEEGSLPFSAGDEGVPAQALYDAIKERDSDAPEIMQGIYNDIRSPEERAEAEPTPAEEAEPTSEAEEVPEAEAPRYDSLPPLFDGLTEDEKQGILNGEDYKEYLPENQEFDVPEGYQPIFSEPFENVEENPDFDPINLANNFEAEDLKEALAEGLRPDADRPGYGTVGRIDEDGEESFTTAPLAAIRDALQMQGEETNDFIDEVYSEGREVTAEEVDDVLGELFGDEEAEGADDLGTETREDGTTSSTVTAPNGKTYSVGTRRNEEGGIDLVMSDSEGREFVESTGEENELEDLNNQAADYARSIRDGDEVGEAFAELIDAEEVSEPEPTSEAELPPTPEAETPREPFTDDPDKSLAERAKDYSDQLNELSERIFDVEAPEGLSEEEQGDLQLFQEETSGTLSSAAEKIDEAFQDPDNIDENALTEAGNLIDGAKNMLDQFKDTRDYETDALDGFDSDLRNVSNQFDDYYQDVMDRPVSGPDEDEDVVDEDLEPTPTPTPEAEPTPTPTPEPVVDGVEVVPGQPEVVRNEKGKFITAGGDWIFSLGYGTGPGYWILTDQGRAKDPADREPEPNFDPYEELVFPGPRIPGITPEEQDDATSTGEGRTPPKPNTPSSALIPDKTFYHVDENGNLVVYTPEYVSYLLSADPSALDNRELNDLLEIFNQLPNAYAQAYEAKRVKAESIQIDRVLGAPEPVSRFSGTRFAELPEVPLPSGEDIPRTPRRPRRPRPPFTPGEYVPGFGPPPRPTPPEFPIPGEGKKANLNRRGRGLLGAIESVLNALLDFRMPQSFYPNLPQSERENLFNNQLANFEQTLENIRTALRNYIKTKDGSGLNQEALDDLAAEIDRARRLLSRLERGGFRGDRGEERHPSLAQAEDYLNQLSDWIEDAVDPEWTPEPVAPSQAPAPFRRRPRFPGDFFPTRWTLGEDGRYVPDNRFFGDTRPDYNSVDVDAISDDEALDLTKSALEDIFDSMPIYGDVPENSPYLKPDVISYDPNAPGETEKRDAAKKAMARILQEAMAKAGIADAWEEENEGEEFDFSSDQIFKNAELTSSPFLNQNYLKEQITKLTTLITDKNADPEELAFLLNSLQPVLRPSAPNKDLDDNLLIQQIRGNEKLARIIQKGLSVHGIAIDADDPAEVFKPKSRTRKPSLPKPKPEPTPEGEPQAEEPKKPRAPRKTPVKPAKKTGELTPKQAQKARDEKEEALPAVLGPDGEKFYEAEVPDVELDFSDEQFPPNEEQEAIIKASLTRVPLLVVRALAGTGKSTTLKMIARQWLKIDPSFSILNISFNKSIQAEASRTMPENVSSSTADSLANRGLNADPKWRFMVQRLNANSQDKYKGTVLYTRADIATYFEVDNMTINGQDVGFTDVVRMAQDAVREYTISADDVIEAKHFKNFDNPADVPPQLIDLANRMWADKTDPEGRLQVKHEDIFKQFALLKPDLRKSGPGRPAFDMLFVDEAQDLNPVLSKLVMDQDIPVIMVGDSNQAIYGFRGASDELDKVVPNIDLPLTKSYRFGPQVAQIGNRFLSLLKSPFRVRGAGGESRIVEPGSMQDPDAIITRTTVGKVAAALDAIKNGLRVSMDRNSREDLIEFINSARSLRFNEPEKVTHQDLRGYSSWQEFLQDIESGNAGSKAKQLFRYISTKEGTDALRDLSKRVKFPFVEGLTAERYIPEITAEELDGSEPFVIYTSPSTKRFVSKEEKAEAKAQGKTPPRSKQSSVPMLATAQKNEDGSIDVYLWSNLFSGPSRNKYLYDPRRIGFGEVIKGENLGDSPIPPNKNGKIPDASKVTFVADENGSAEENALAAMNDLRTSMQGVRPEETDITIITAHVSKGLEFDRVKISDDFAAERFSPQRDPETGEIILPDDEELRLDYVAVTRAIKELDPGGLAWIFDQTTEADADSPNPESPESVVSGPDGSLNEEFSGLLRDARLNPVFYLSRDPETAKKVLEAKRNLPGADVEEIDRVLGLINAASAPEPASPTVEERAQNDREGFEALNAQLPDNEKIDIPDQKNLEEDVSSSSPDRNVARIEQELAIDNLGGGQWQIWKKDITGPDGKIRRYEIIIQKNRGNTFSVLHRSHDVTNEGKSNKTALVDPVVINSYPASDGYRYLKTLAEEARAEIALALSRAPRTSQGQSDAIIRIFGEKASFDLPQERIDNPAATHISADGYTDIRELFENLPAGERIRVYDHVRGEWGYVVKILDSYSSYGYADYVEWIPDGENRAVTRGPAKNYFVVDEATGAWTPAEGVSVPDFYKGERRVPVDAPLDGYDNPPVPTKVKQDRQLEEKRREQERKRAARAARAAGRGDQQGGGDSDGDEDTPPSGDDGGGTPPQTPGDGDTGPDGGVWTDQDTEDAQDVLSDLFDSIGDDDAAGPDEGPIPGDWTRADKQQFLGETREKIGQSLIKSWTSTGYKAEVLSQVAKSLPAEIQEKLANKERLGDSESQAVFAAMEQALSGRAVAVAEEFIRLRVGSPSKIYKSSRGSTVAVSARDVSQEQIDYFLESIDQLESLVSYPNMTYVLSNKLGKDAATGSTILSDHIMLIRPSIVVKGDALDTAVAQNNWAAPRKYRGYQPLTREDLTPQQIKHFQGQFDSIFTEGNTSGLLVTLLHEMGHAVDQLYTTPTADKPSRSRVFSDEELYKSQNPEGHKALLNYMDKSSSSGSYGRSDMAEAYAESFAHWAVSGGEPKSPQVAAIAEAFGWNERFPSVRRIRNNPERYAPGSSFSSEIQGERRRSESPEVDTAYRMQHTAPNRDYGTSADNLEEMMPDFYSRPELYRTGDKTSDDESLAALEAIKGNPDAMVTVYRSAPEGSTINPGDWVSLSREYATQHGFGETEDQDMPVFSREVRAGDLFTDGNSINEFGWDPEEPVEGEERLSPDDFKVLKDRQLNQAPYTEAAISPTATKRLETLEERDRRAATRLRFPTTLRGMSRDLRKQMRDGMARIGITNYKDMDRNIEETLLRAWPELEGKSAEEALADGATEPEGFYWYNEAGGEAERIAQENGFTRSQVSAMIAATSPREPWDSNSVIAEYFARAVSEDHEVQVDALLETMAPNKGVTLYFDAQTSLEREPIDGAARTMPSPEELRGKRISDLDPYTAAAIIKAQGKLGYRTEGVGGTDQNGNAVNSEGSGLRGISSETGRPIAVVYNSGITGTGRAVRVARGEDPNLMLNGHKVRSFYNNIAELQDPEGPGDVTVDSHALAVALGYKISSSSEEYKIFSAGMSSAPFGIIGYYAPVADAYRRVAQKYGIEPRQAQAVTWVQWRKNPQGRQA